MKLHSLLVGGYISYFACKYTLIIKMFVNHKVQHKPWDLWFLVGTQIVILDCAYEEGCNFFLTA